MLRFKIQSILSDKEEHTKEELIGKAPWEPEEKTEDKTKEWKKEAHSRGLKTGN